MNKSLMVICLIVLFGCGKNDGRDWILSQYREKMLDRGRLPHDLCIDKTSQTMISSVVTNIYEYFLFNQGVDIHFPIVYAVVLSKDRQLLWNYQTKQVDSGIVFMYLEYSKNESKGSGKKYVRAPAKNFTLLYKNCGQLFSICKDEAGINRNCLFRGTFNDPFFDQEISFNDDSPQWKDMDFTTFTPSNCCMLISDSPWVMNPRLMTNEIDTIKKQLTSHVFELVSSSSDFLLFLPKNYISGTDAKNGVFVHE